jgi:hypothetical protein
MTDLRSALEKYLSMRKGLGYKYEHQTQRLGDFVVFMEKRNAKTITTKLAMEWATLPPADDTDLLARASRTPGGSVGKPQAIPGRQSNPLPPRRPVTCLPGRALSD